MSTNCFCKAPMCANKEDTGTYFCRELHQPLWLESPERKEVDWLNEQSYELAVANFYIRLKHEPGSTQKENDQTLVVMHADRHSSI